MNIDIDNLVQFLPQERVSDFAGLTPPELLKSTEVAIGGPELRDLHKKLIEVKKRLMGDATTISAREKALEDLREQNEKLKSEVKRFKERQGQSSSFILI